MTTISSAVVFHHLGNHQSPISLC